MRFPAIILSTILLVSCGDKKSSQETKPPSGGKTVLTTFYPTQYFAERIAGEQLEIACPLPDDADPIFWRPDSASLQKFQSADMIIINGAGFEKWIATVSLPENRIVDTTKSFEQDFIRYESSTTHKHGKDGEEHTHTGIDGHTWVDPATAKIQAAAIHQAFAKKWPEHASVFETNFKSLVADLDSLDAALKAIDPDQPMLASHPAYNYLVRRYGWKVTNLDLVPSNMPRRGAIKPDEPAKIILWESEPIPKAIELLEKKHGLKSVVFSPAEQRGELDYLETMRANIKRLTEALSSADL